MRDACVDTVLAEVTYSSRTRVLTYFLPSMLGRCVPQPRLTCLRVTCRNITRGTRVTVMTRVTAQPPAQHPEVPGGAAGHGEPGSGRGLQHHQAGGHLQRHQPQTKPGLHVLLHPLDQVTIPN